MKVDRTGPVRTGTPARRSEKSGSAGGQSFTWHVERSSDAGAAVGGVASIHPVDSLLSIQEVGDSTSEGKRRRARRWGEDVLDQLDCLRLGLVMGIVPRHELKRIAQLVERQRAQLDDPLLTAVLDEIELRARVEIAKFGRKT